MKDPELPKVLRAKKKDLSDWYHQILFLADIVDIRYNVKGMNVWKSYGYDTILALKSYWDELFRNQGIKEMYFPQIIPKDYCEMNPEWWEGFKAEGFKVIAGDKDEVQGALRPTGEAAMYPMYSMWIRSISDLPFRAYETVSSFRYETAHTRPLIRDREITLWHEVHTCHATKEDSLKEAETHIEIYKQIWNHVAMHPLIVDKPEWEVFPGAVGGVEFYNVTPEGKAMENGSVNILGQAYSKKFNITFKDSDGEEKHVWQVCTGNGARLLAGMFIQHGDDKGLVLPPTIAPYQIVIVPIIIKGKEEQVMSAAKNLEKRFEKAGFRVHLDDSDDTPGRKYYEWELKGVPLRAEVGPKDVEKGQAVLVKRTDGKKEFVKTEEIMARTKILFEEIHDYLLDKAVADTNSKIEYAESTDKMASVLDDAKVAKVHWCRAGECYDRIKEVREGAEIFGSEYYDKGQGNCVVCGKDTDNLAYVAKTY